MPPCKESILKKIFSFLLVCRNVQLSVEKIYNSKKKKKSKKK